MALIFPELHPLHIVRLASTKRFINCTICSNLIGLLQSPYGYTPYEKDGTLKSDKDLKYKTIQRQHYVLKRMLIQRSNH